MSKKVLSRTEEGTVEDTRGKGKAGTRSLSRRNFVKVAAVAGIAAASTAGVAKTAVSLIPEPDYQKRYDNDVLPGDRDIANSKLTLMTEREKRDFVRDAKKNYKYT